MRAPSFSRYRASDRPFVIKRIQRSKLNIVSKIKPKPRRGQFPRRAALVVGAALACAVGCIFLVVILGRPALVATSFPVVVIAANYGKWYGTGAALTAIIFNSLLVIFATDSTWFEWIKSGGAFGHIALIGIVLLAAWLRQALRDFSDSEKALNAAKIVIQRLADDNEFSLDRRKRPS